MYFFTIFPGFLVKLVFFSVFNVFFAFQGRFLIPNGSPWGVPGHHFGAILETSSPRRVQWTPWTPKSAILTPFWWSFGSLLVSFWSVRGCFSVNFLCVSGCTGVVSSRQFPMFFMIRFFRF